MAIKKTEPEKKQAEVNPQVEAEKKKTQIATLNKRLGEFESMITQDYYRESITGLLTRHVIDPQKFLQTCINIFRKTPMLLMCDFNDIYFNILACAEVGLEPNTVKEHAFLVPFHNKATGKYNVGIIFGYKGIREIIYRNPAVTKIRAELIHENDDFQESVVNNIQIINHIKARENRGRRIGVYVQVFYSNTEPETKVMYAEQIMAIKAKSKNPQKYEADNDPEGWYWKKAAIKQMGKMMSDSHDLGKSIHIDNVFEGGDGRFALQDNKLLLIEQGKPIKGLKTSVFGTQKTEEIKQSVIANLPSSQEQ